MNILRQALESSQPLIQWTPWPSSLAVEWPGCQADHYCTSCTQFRNERAVSPILPCPFMECSGTTVHCNILLW